MTCDANCTDTATVNWTNGGTYDSINVYINGVFETSLGGSETSYSANPINGVRDICLEPVVGGTVGALACCTAFGLTPPPVNVACDPLFGTPDVAVAWTNPVPYNAIEVYVGGTLYASLPGTDNFITVNGAGTAQICVRGLIANCWSDFACCTGGGGGTSPITNVTCDANCTDTSTVNWTNGGAYDSINVYINGTFETTLAGSATTYSASPINGIRDICLEPVIGSTAGPQTCCTAFGLTPPPVNVSCDRISGTTDVAVAWINPVTYNAIEVYVAGAFFASLPGTAQTIMVPGAGTNEICVRGLLANCWSDFECCTGGGGTASPITNMTCNASCTDTATVNWTNGGAYDSINVYINGTFETSLAGSATTYSASPIVGIRNICLEPVIGSTAGPQTCCTAFGLTPPPVNVVCDPIGGTSEVFVAWDLPLAYDGIEIWVNGVFDTSLPGTATTFTVAAGVGREICVRGLLANCWSELVCCDDTGTPPGVGSINCDPNEPNSQVAVVWTPPIVYDTVEISLNGVVVQTIPGTASPFVTVTGVTGVREICVTGIIGGIATEPACCTVDMGPGPEIFIRGDTNHDGLFNIADAIQALGELFSGVPSFGCPDANDANDDGSNDIGDAIGILTTLFSGGSIPAPHPGCGPDPTPDALGPCTHAACP